MSEGAQDEFILKESAIGIEPLAAFDGGEGWVGDAREVFGSEDQRGDSFKLPATPPEPRMDSRFRGKDGGGARSMDEGRMRPLTGRGGALLP